MKPRQESTEYKIVKLVMQEKNMHTKGREPRYDFDLVVLESRNGCRAVKINQATFLAGFRTHLIDPFF